MCAALFVVFEIVFQDPAQPGLMEDDDVVLSLPKSPSVPCLSAKLRRAMILIHVTCYTASLYAIHFKRVLNFGEGQD
jgi:hypothetical protein